MDKERIIEELKIISNCYDSLTQYMNILLGHTLDVYAKFESKEEINKLVEIEKDFRNVVVTENNNIITKILDL